MPYQPNNIPYHIYTTGNNWTTFFGRSISTKNMYMLLSYVIVRICIIAQEQDRAVELDLKLKTFRGEENAS